MGVIIVAKWWEHYKETERLTNKCLLCVLASGTLGKGTVTEPDDLSSVPGIHMVEGVNRFP